MKKLEFEDMEIKIADFGFATYFSSKEKENKLFGTPNYMAPEVIKQISYDEKIDVWSAGVIAYYLLT